MVRVVTAGDEVLKDILRSLLDALNDGPAEGSSASHGDCPRKGRPDCRGHAGKAEPVQQDLDGEGIGGAGGDAEYSGERDLLIAEARAAGLSFRIVEVDGALGRLALAEAAEKDGTTSGARPVGHRDAGDHGTKALADAARPVVRTVAWDVGDHPLRELPDLLAEAIGCPLGHGHHRVGEDLLLDALPLGLPLLGRHSAVREPERTIRLRR